MGNAEDNKDIMKTPLIHPQNQKFLIIIDSANESIKLFFLPCCEKGLEFFLGPIAVTGPIPMSLRSKYEATNPCKTS